MVRSYTETDVDHIRTIVATRPQNLSLQEFYLAAMGLDPESEAFAEIFDVAVRMYPNDPVANLNAANAAMQAGNHVAAQRYIDRAGNMPEALYAKGVLAALMDDIDAARSYFEEAARLGVDIAKEHIDF